MKAIILERYGKKGRMYLGDMPEPKLHKYLHNF